MPIMPIYIPRANMPADPGKYRDQIRIQEKTVSGQDSYGADVLTWTTKYTAFAAVRQLSGTESAKLQQRWARAAFEVECQYLSGVTEDMRISWWDGVNHRTLNILSAVDPEGRRGKLWMICEEVKGSV